jgi:predicted DCC family thiol-disulfide oxidoreductase YuxK
VVLDLGSDHALARDLAAGGVFVPGCVVALGDECDLVVRAEPDELVLVARVVFVDPRGAGLELVGCGPELKDQLAAMANAATQRAEGADEDVTSSYGVVTADDHDEVVESDAARKIARNIHERLRGLTLVQQHKIAKHGEVSERIVLERMYGKSVWEHLLRNPRITAPEVARIARMGALPRPMVEVICNNGAWLQIPEIRRALLSNPRLGTDQILRVLRLVPKHELKLAATATSYPHPVRDAAKRLLRDGDGVH